MNKNRKAIRLVGLIVPVVSLVCGLYLLLNASAPLLPAVAFLESADETANELESTQPQIGENRLYIPKINVDVEIVSGDDWQVLERGAWHRHPENGNPSGGGNFVLSAHRFTLGWTPQQTRLESPFYNIDKLEGGDKIYVDWDGKRYEYEVARRYSVARTATEIENRTTEAKMTLYSCDLKGEMAGREVIEAALLTDLL